jgi:hypothetical protein
MKIASSEIQMATANLNKTNQSGSSVNQVQELIQDKVTLSQEQTLTTFLIDEMGYVEVEPIQVGLFFTLMHNRHKKKTTLITSNLGFDQWTSYPSIKRLRPTQHDWNDQLRSLQIAF